MALGRSDRVWRRMREGRVFCFRAQFLRFYSLSFPFFFFFVPVILFLYKVIPGSVLFFKQSAPHRGGDVVTSSLLSLVPFTHPREKVCGSALQIFHRHSLFPVSGRDSCTVDTSEHGAFSSTHVLPYLHQRIKKKAEDQIFQLPISV